MDVVLYNRARHGPPYLSTLRFLQSQTTTQFVRLCQPRSVRGGLQLNISAWARAPMRIVHHRATDPDQVWAWDFVHDRTEDGRPLKFLSIVDEYTRECLALEVRRSFKSADVIDVLKELFLIRGVPRHIRSGTTARSSLPARSSPGWGSRRCGRCT